MPRAHNRVFTRSARRQTAWGSGPGSDSTGGAQQITGVTGTLWGVFNTPSVEGLTLIRVRGMIELRLSTITAAGDGFSGAIGLGIADNRAINAGVASVPLPFSGDDIHEELLSPVGPLTLPLLSTYNEEAPGATLCLRRLPSPFLSLTRVWLASLNTPVQMGPTATSATTGSTRRTQE